MLLPFALIILAIAVLVVLFFKVLRFRERRRPRELHRQWEDRELKIKKAFWRREVVEAKVRSLFPRYAATEILKLLDADAPSLRELERTQLAILKLSNGDLDQLRYHLDAAKRDFFKVISPAEYPEESFLGLDIFELQYEEQSRISNRDIRQYLHWLRKR